MTQAKHSKPKKNNSVRKPIQLNIPQPIFATKTSAKEYYQQALQAYHANQAQEAHDLSLKCIETAHRDPILKIEAISLCAAALMMMQQKEQALALWLEIDKSLPHDVNNLSNIGMVLIQLQQFTDAISYLKRAVNIQPHFNSYWNLGFALHQCGDLRQAKANYLNALKCDPKSIQTRLNLAEVLRDEGRSDESMQIYGQILKMDPKNIDILSIRIFVQSFIYPTNTSHHIELLTAYQQRFNNVPSKTYPPHITYHRPLRVGFVSGDLRQHPVGYFLTSTLEQLRLDPTLNKQLTLIAYHNFGLVDSYSERLFPNFDIWYQVHDWSETRLAEQITQDEIDILIDLSGHTIATRLPVFAQKPAPLQISWLGYFGSTGLTSIDYILADPICIPLGEEQGFVEKIWRLPHLRYCLSIPQNAPEVSPPPCLHHSQVIFGCNQSLHKIHSGVLNCWAMILSATPHARIRIQTKNLGKQGILASFIERLKTAGIDTQRIDLIDAVSYSQYLASYTEVDIMLDTFPFTGGTTTAEALWMGVPTLTLSLPSMLSRQGEALLVNAGLSDWVTYNEKDYIQKAIDWANSGIQKRQALAQLRSRMREQVRQSPVFNAAQFAKEFVEALHGMWNDKYPTAITNKSDPYLKF